MLRIVLKALVIIPLTCCLADMSVEAADNSNIVLNVCEILPKLESYRGRMIAVRGPLYRSREIFALGGVDCPATFVTAGFRWATAIDLVSSTYRPPGVESVEFSTDEVAMQALKQKINDQAKDGAELWVTFIGQLRVRTEYFVARGADGRLYGNGYGHLSIYPAQLVIKLCKM